MHAFVKELSLLRLSRWGMPGLYGQKEKNPLIGSGSLA
jgi:hypothetical protein